MKENLYELFVRNLLTHIPSNIKTSAYLVDLLGLGREAVYRRIRGKIPFTMDEIITIAVSLNVSIDDIIYRNNETPERVSYDLSLIESVEYSQILQSSLNQLYSTFLNQEVQEISFAINRFHPIFFAEFDELFKFFYYRWLCQNDTVNHTKKTFSATHVTPELDRLKTQISEGIQRLNQTNMILDSNIFLNLIKEIQYFEQKKLITSEEKQLIKKDLSNFISSYEQMTKTGRVGSKRLFVYLSVYLPIYSNSGLAQLDNEWKSFFRFSTIPHQITNNQQICALQRTGLDFIKRQSICITQSNEIMQKEFFEKQRQHLDML